MLLVDVATCDDMNAINKVGQLIKLAYLQAMLVVASVSSRAGANRIHCHSVASIQLPQ